MAEQVTVTLGGQEYLLRPLTLRPARAFRERMTAQISEISEIVGQVESVQIDDLHAMGGMIQRISELALGSVDILAAWLREYSPEIAADWERIETEAFDDEVIAAFLEVLKMLYPFGGLKKLLIGLRAQAMQTS